ncbi:hypothetical protein B0H14DRAFT_2568382 [Mycena olivaceomarginata]|nr:hypothetical protein B0H14DRAFT_2568382 [Mycena olivaceomarginata]
MSPEPIRDQAYYLETVVFEVSHVFNSNANSGIFATTFSLPGPVNGAEGSSDKTPFKLNGIKCVGLSQAVESVISDVSHRVRDTHRYKTPSLSQDGWISVLKLANLWDFIEVRNLAIEQLGPYSESLDCIERILFARKFDVSAWLRSGYSELARRRAAISFREAEKDRVGGRSADLSNPGGDSLDCLATKTRTGTPASGTYSGQNSSAQTLPTSHYRLFPE